jgi:phosphoribosyl 1,2-cyclic phosphodiesterase
LKFASLGSGSEGNGLLVEAQVQDRTVRVLLDCGFGRKEFISRLAALGVEPQTLDAIVVTHEHGDHVGGVASLAKSLKIPVHTTFGTALAGRLFERVPDWVRVIRADHNLGRFDIKGLQIEAVTVPHDAREPVQFVFDDGAHRLGVLTDLGHVSAHVAQRFENLTALVLECNHDPKMLAASDYPYHLKRRISGVHGHLSNENAAAFLAAMSRTRLGVIAAAHLSRQNNTKQLACGTLADALGVQAKEFWVADQDAGLQWLPAR